MKISSYTKLGLIVAISAFLLIWGINFLKGYDFFKDEDSYFAIYDKIDGLQVAAPVVIRGYRVGQVREIYFHPDQTGRLIVRMMVDKRVKLPTNTSAKIFSSDLMGSKSIELIYTKNPVFHIPGDTLFAETEGSIQEQVSLQMLPLKNQAERLMKDMEKAIAGLNIIFNENTRENLTKSFESIKIAIEKIEHASYTLDTVVTYQKSRMERILLNVESITLNIRNNNEKIAAIIANFTVISDSLRKAEIQKTLIIANHALEQVDQVFDKINRGEGTIGLLVHNDTLYRNLELASKNLNALVFDIQENPKRYIHFSVFGRKDKKAKKKNNETSFRYSIILNPASELIPEDKLKTVGSIGDVELISQNDSNFYCLNLKPDPVELLFPLFMVQKLLPHAQIVKIESGFLPK